MREFLNGMRDGFRKSMATPWSVVVAGYFGPLTGLVRMVFLWTDQAMDDAQRRHDRKMAGH
jgi:hypothetical protein